MKTTDCTILRWLLAGALGVSVFGLSVQADLKHRYSFTTDASDSVGGAHGTLEGDAAILGGAVLLNGAAGTYVNLPGGLLQDYTEVSLEAWVSFWPGGAWARLYDFGAISGSNGRNYIMFTPRSGSGDTRLSISDADPGYNHEQMVIVPGTLDDGSPRHVVAVYKPAQNWAAMYVDGLLVGSSQNITIPLSAVAPDHCFLGRSLYAPDAWLNGDIDEFRIHSRALGSGEVAASYFGGANAVNYSPGTVSTFTMTLPAQIPEKGVAVPEYAATYSVAGAVTPGVIEVALTSSNPDVVEVRADGTLYGKAPGTAVITAELGGRQATASLLVQASPVVLAHRYSFNEPAGAFEVTDSVGGQNGLLFPSFDGANQVTLGNGQAIFPGGAGYQDGAYIDLPNGIISSKQNVTIEVWCTWNGPAGSFWQRIFDFGNSQKGDNPHASGNGTGAFFLTPLGGGGVVRYAAGPTGFAGEQTLDGLATLPIGQEAHVVCVYAPDSRLSQLWVDGRLVRSAGAPFPLSELQDVNNWLGVSGWNDPPLNGSINELRIYEGGLTELEIALSRQAGPNTVPASPGLLQGIRLEVPPLLAGNPAAAQAVLRADYQNMPNVDVSALSGAQFASSDPDIFTVTAAGGLLPVGIGTAELTGTYQGLSTSVEVAVLAPVSLALEVPATLPAGGPAANAILTATFPGDVTANVAGFAGVEFVSAAPGVATVGAVSGVLLTRGAGSTVITGSYGGLNAQDTLEVTLPAGHQMAELIHRYSFDGAPGSVAVTDSVGSSHGELINPSAESAFTGTGRLRLQGGAWDAAVQSGYVNLPNGLVSGLPSMTIEGWIRWAGPAGSSWQRIFDFGRNSAVDGFGNPLEDVYGNPGVSYTFLTPRSGDNTFRFAIKEGTGPEVPQLNAPALPVDQDVHFVVVYDTAAGAVRMYRDGVRIATGAVTHPLSVLEDINVYLGRSQWTDSYFAGEFDEFRIFRGTWLDREVALSFQAGPNTLPDLTPAPELMAVVDGANLLLSWPATATGFNLQTSPRVGPQAAWAPVGTNPVEQGGRWVVTVPLTGEAAFFRVLR